MGKKIVLDLCGGTGAWSKPYKEAGYDVRVITLPCYDVKTYSPVGDVYGILAAPPCNHFSVMRTNTAFVPRNVYSAFEIVKGCLRIIWLCSYNKTLKFWTLENPATGMLKRFLGYPAFVFHPWEFGDRASKLTGLWGYFKEPVKNPKPLTKEEKEYQRKYHIHKFPLAKEKPGLSRAARRAITPQGFAKAFFEANR